VDKHIRLKTYPANPAKGFEGVKNPLPDGENPCRVVYPAPTRQNPATGVQGVKNPLPDGENPCRVGYPVPPLLSGGVGWVSGESPDKGFCDKEGCKPLLEGDLSGLSGGFSGECVDPLLAGYCRVLPGTCRVRYPARILPMGKGEIPPLRGTCRVCRVGLQGGSDAD
jgi:hypothetical protein